MASKCLALDRTLFKILGRENPVARRLPYFGDIDCCCVTGSLLNNVFLTVNIWSYASKVRTDHFLANIT